jgi:hypothetical protein
MYYSQPLCHIDNILNINQLHQNFGMNFFPGRERITKMSLTGFEIF